ncbi:MAG: phosphopentomutase [Cyanobacteria bacterium]|nr:phosphopentomutase [Cyanobacteriota bacterium]
MPKRAIILVIDALGVGSLPDWADYDEVSESNTLASTCKYMAQNHQAIKLPNLQKLGLANITSLKGLSPLEKTTGSYGKMAELNPAKDTITGHWEMMGIRASKPFPYYPNGFPAEIIEQLKKQFGVEGILCNSTASGTTVINELGDKHRETGFPIVYTSADSVLQIACDVDVVPVETLYKWCELAREIMRGEHEVARIIARPFKRNENWVEGSSPAKAADMKYVRLGDKRHDYSVLPHAKSVLEMVLENQGHVVGFGKIQDIFAGVGVPENIHTASNADGLDKFIAAIKSPAKKNEVLFINLVETDANYGHRRDPEGFAKALEDIDKGMPELLEAMTEEDILMISADHGCDPTAVGSDHTREYVPIIFYNRNMAGKDLGTRKSFADIGATILYWFGLESSELSIPGTSFI